MRAAHGPNKNSIQAVDEHEHEQQMILPRRRKRAVFALGICNENTNAELVKIKQTKKIYAQTKHAANNRATTPQAKVQGQARARARARLSGPGADEAHAHGAEQDEQAGGDAAAAAQDGPAVVAEEVLGEQLDEGGEDEQARRDGVHGAHQDQAKGRVRAVERVRGEADRLADGCAGGSGRVSTL